jgi:hypothetical protein
MTPLVTRVRSTGVSGITKRTQRPALIRTRANIGDIASQFDYGLEQRYESNEFHRITG